MIPRLTRLTAVLCAVLAAGPAASAEPCRDSWKPELESLWDAKKPAWDALCASGLDAKKSEEKVRDDFVVACLGRLAEPLSQKRVSPERAREACRAGKPSESALRRELEAAKDVSGAQEGVASAGKMVASGNIDGVFAESRRGSPGSGASGSGKGASRSVVMQMPTMTITAAPPGSIEDRISKLKYPERIKDYLYTASDYADEQDMRDVLETLEKAKPSLSVKPEGIREAYGHAWSEGKGSAKKHFIELSAGEVTDKSGKTLPMTLSAYYRDEGRKKESKARAPPLALTAPAGKRKDLGVVDGMHVFEYPDGSRLKLYSDVSIAGTLMHEISHVRRDWQGGSANDFTNERDAHDIQYRFYTRYMQAHGGEIPVDSGKKAKIDQWHTDPDGFRQELIADYIANGQIKPGRVTVAEQQRAAQVAQTTAKKYLSRLGTVDRFYYWLTDKTPPAQEVYDGTTEELRQLERDKALSESAAKRQEAWRKERELGFLRMMNDNIDAQIAKIRSSNMRPAVKKARIAELEGYRKEGRENPWFYIPKLGSP